MANYAGGDVSALFYKNHITDKAYQWLEQTQNTKHSSLKHIKKN